MRDLQAVQGTIGVDASSAKFKNFPLFKTKYYYGIDISEEAIKGGLRIYPDGIGIIADLNTLQLPECSIDVAVSTNTLHYISGLNRLAVSRKLSKSIKSGGRLLLHLPIDEYYDRIIQELKKTFVIVRIKYFRNIISRAYEDLLETKNGFFPIAASKPFLSFSFILSRIEMLTQYKRTWNREAYICCLQKRKTKPENKFTLNDTTLVSRNLYKLLMR